MIEFHNTVRVTLVDRHACCVSTRRQQFAVDPPIEFDAMASAARDRRGSGEAAYR
jgi:hypothetical protein